MARKWISTAEAAVAMGVSRQRVNQLLLAKRIKGAERVGPDGRWAIPTRIVLLKGGKPGRPKKAQ